MEISGYLVITDLFSLKNFPAMLRTIVEDIHLDVVRHIICYKSNSDRIISCWCHTVKSNIHDRRKEFVQPKVDAPFDNAVLSIKIDRTWKIIAKSIFYSSTSSGMVHNHWIEDIPVIMISSEDSEPYIRRAYELGVSDYINRPFDAKVVYQRVYNTIKLYAKQRKLVTLVTDQIYEKEKNNQMMISILSQIVEFRNGESGLHVLHINILSELLLERLVQKTDKYQISAQRRSLITTASALHDIGKIGIDDKILNKPGRLTPEEFDEMKKHTIIGESILKNVGIYQNEELVQLAMQICRWHHERYDGRGYPDGLKGEEIPIEVQVVSIADVYDALVSERVYKKAYSHKKAVEMILNGECGQFNPLLLECLQDIQDRIDEEFQNVENQSEEENQERKVHDQIMETTVLG